jgi:excisionase family DNA binding protein
MPDVLSVRDVAEVLGVSTKTVYGWIGSGELATLDLSGDRRLVAKEQILELIAEAGRKKRTCGDAP